MNKAARIFGVLTVALVLTTGCSSSPQSQQAVREDTARATAAIKSDVKAAALGIRDGLRQNTSADAIDINTATRAQLEALPGLTPAMAGQIIAHRPYANPADLRRKHILPVEEYNKVSSRLTASH